MKWLEKLCSTCKDRKMFSPAKTILFILLALFIQSSNAYTQNHKNKLQTVKKQILTLKSEISNSKAKKEKIEKLLKHSEVKIGKLRKDISYILSRKNNLENRLKKLQAEAHQLKNKLIKNKEIFNNNLKQTAILGRQNEIQLALNTSDPQKTQRILTEYRYFTANQLQTIKRIKQNLSDINRSKIKIIQTTKELKQTNKSHAKQLKNIKLEQKNRLQILARVDEKIFDHIERLKELTKDRVYLSSLIKKINTTKKTKITNFRKLKGKLPWPVRGKLYYDFGDKIPNTNLKRQAISIKASNQKPVHAIANGKVVFANWLPRYGQLLIIDHGNGFMSLYGHNEIMYKKVGDKVNTKEVISTVGVSGGYKHPSLFFAMRHKGFPLNPHWWLKK